MALSSHSPKRNGRVNRGSRAILQKGTVTIRRHPAYAERALRHESLPLRSCVLSFRPDEMLGAPFLAKVGQRLRPDWGAQRPVLPPTLPDGATAQRPLANALRATATLGRPWLVHQHARPRLAGRRPLACHAVPWYRVPAWFAAQAVASESGGGARLSGDMEEPALGAGGCTARALAARRVGASEENHRVRIIWSRE